MVGVHEQNGLRSAPERGVEQHPALPRFLHDALDGRGIRADDGENARSGGGAAPDQKLRCFT